MIPRRRVRHHPDELRTEVSEAGFAVEAVLGVEGLGWALPDLAVRWADPARRAEILAAARAVETEPSLLGVHAHILGGGPRRTRRRPMIATDVLSAARASTTVLGGDCDGVTRDRDAMSGWLTRRERCAVPFALAVLALLANNAPAEVRLPPGFVKEVYVTGQGFATGRGSRGIPATSTLVFDRSGNLFLARTGARYQNTETDDLTPVYRVPPGGGHLTPETEPRYLYGPPLRNAQAAAVRAGLELFVTTFDRDRRLGVVYRVVDGRAELFAGGTPPREAPPLLRQPEGMAVDSAGRLYVADRESGLVLRLDPAGRVLDPRYALVRRPRVLAIDATDALWIGADGNAEAPWQHGPGEIWRVPRDGPPALVLRGPIPAALAMSRGGHLLVADRQGSELFALTPEGQRVPFLAYTQGDAPRGLAFAPDTPETRRAGIAGDLFVATINLGAWTVNEIVRISGPFDELIRERATTSP